MDTEAIYQAVCDYGQAKYNCWESDAADHLSQIKRLLYEAEAEHKSLLDENERLVDELQAARQEISELSKENERLNDLACGWMPIDSAPKDGTLVIIGRHMDGFGFVKGYGRFEGSPGAFCSGWISCGFDAVTGNLGLAHPTHWMPLPKPPEAK